VRDNGVVGSAGIIIEANALSNLTCGNGLPFLLTSVVMPEGLVVIRTRGSDEPPHVALCGALKEVTIF
jgi:hypothetical protein